MIFSFAACANVCCMGVDPSEDPNDTECIRCGACIKEYPAKALTYEFRIRRESVMSEMK